jgi:predicted O-linked N-acetylglucosamine transferase (SPINDLY family)
MSNHMPTVSEALASAVAHHRAGRLQEADALYRRILADVPDHPDCLHLVGYIEYQQGRHESAAEWIRQAIRQNDRVPSFHHHLGLALRALGRREEAASALRMAVILDPRAPGVSLDLGLTLLEMGTTDAAVDALRAELACAPHNRSALLNLGVALYRQEKLDEAKACFQRLVDVDPGYAAAWNNLAGMHLEHGEIEAAVAGYDHAIGLDANYATAYSNRLMCEQYRATVTPENLLTLSQGWDDRYAPKPAPVLPTAARAAALPLRLGFVSPDFLRSPVGYFLHGLLRHLDREQAQTFLYSDTSRPDDLTAELKSLASVWRNTSGLSDDRVLAILRADNLDLLFDLAGHTEGNRLRVFANRAAPTQATWAGYAGTTGLATMDFLIADRWHVPQGSESCYCERILRMPHDYVCYTPPHYAPEVAPLPIERTGVLTLAAFHNVGKIGAPSVELWAQVLRALPDAHLIMKYKKLTDPVVQARILGMFAQAGIVAERLVIEGTSPHRAMLARYRDVDIALDSRPYSGGLTTLEALWMGVPVITIPGRTFAGRHSLSHLSNAGLADLAARDEADFVQRVVELSRDVARLAELRRSLRGRLAASPIGDCQRFAADFLDVARGATNALQ